MCTSTVSSLLHLIWYLSMIVSLCTHPAAAYSRASSMHHFCQEEWDHWLKDLPTFPASLQVGRLSYSARQSDCSTRTARSWHTKHLLIIGSVKLRADKRSVDSGWSGPSLIAEAKAYRDVKEQHFEATSAYCTVQRLGWHHPIMYPVCLIGLHSLTSQSL